MGRMQGGGFVSSDEPPPETEMLGKKHNLMVFIRG